MRPEHWKAMTAFTRAQYGLVTYQQLHQVGVPDRTIRDAVRVGSLVIERREVFALAGSPPSLHRPLLAACLAGGDDTVASHRAAAWLWGSSAVQPGLLEVTRLLGRSNRLTGVLTHQTTKLLPRDRALLAGLPVTSAARTAIDLGSCFTPWLLIRFVEHLDRINALAAGELEAELEHLGGRGRPGTRTLRRIVAERHEGLRPGDSDLEVRVVRQLVRLGLPRPAQNYQVEVGSRVFILDLAWPDAKIAVEVDGFAFHSSRSAFDHDRHRDLLLKRAGWEVIRVTSKTDLTLVAAFLRQRLQCAS